MPDQILLTGFGAGDAGEQTETRWLMALSLIIVCDPAAACAFADRVRDSGFHVRHHSQAAPALQSAIESLPDMVLFDSADVPDRWLQACQSFRSEGETRQLPIVVICQTGTAEERLALLEAGADDCWTEPLDSRACAIRLQAVARRFDLGDAGHVLRYADVEFDLDRLKVKRGGRVIDLTPMQMRLLRHFMESPGIIFSRKQLLEKLWSKSEVDEGAVTACVIRLRRALNVAGPNIIRLVPTAGYALDGDYEPRQRIASGAKSELSQSTNSFVIGPS